MRAKQVRKVIFFNGIIVFQENFLDQMAASVVLLAVNICSFYLTQCFPKKLSTVRFQIQADLAFKVLSVFGYQINCSTLSFLFCYALSMLHHVSDECMWQRLIMRKLHRTFALLVAFQGIGKGSMGIG